MARTLSMFDGDSDHQDLHLDARGDLAVVEGIEDVRQRVHQRLRFFLGEWFLDVADGIPYREEVFTRPISAGLAAALVTDQISAVPGVTAVKSVDASLDALRRRFTYTAVVTTPYGETEVANG